ncbi:T-lymphocyte activation antigen CD80-like [Seriola dumerili]|uniref:T-lymphocyte activation antigen CD80-like n=1 Tax=Seriola dumerili TaxID=41447 RepID=UPI000BBEF74E|nr:T-lymphocyte activation antigen CD80-like [Seriola dumerili]
MSLFFKLKSKLFFDYFCVLRAQTCPQRAMLVALWRTGLVLSFLSVCACVEQDCVLGIVGRPVSVPCFYPELLTHVNFSIEWRRDDEVVLRSEWEEDVNVGGWSKNSAKLSSDAALTGNLSLELPAVDPTEEKVFYRLFLISGENQSAALCTVCLRTAASFSSPLLQREEAAPADGTTFLCHSSGGFPEPAVYWLINDTEEPPEGSVRTLAASLPDSHLYNITSLLTVNVSKDSRVSCIIENMSMNQTLTSTSYGVQGSPMIRRASEGMWIFSTALCVVVGLMVVAGVAYQIHLDRISKRRKEEYQHQRQNRGYRRRHLYEKEAEAMKLQSKETDV